jgi:hypothetical protein
MKKALIAFGAVVLVGGAVFAGRATVFAQATDLYAKKGAQCLRLVQVANAPSIKLQVAVAGAQGTITSDTGGSWTLYQDAACSTTPVIFVP